MIGSGLLVVAWTCGVLPVACATGSSVEPLEAPDECARCFAENELPTARIEQLVVRVGQLEAELAAQRGFGQGGAFFHTLNYDPCRSVTSPFTQRYERCRAGVASMSALAVSVPALLQGNRRARELRHEGSRRKSSAGTNALRNVPSSLEIDAQGCAGRSGRHVGVSWLLG
jgi:hypothetical protein